MTAVYRIYDPRDELVYVGCSDNVAERVRVARRRFRKEFARVEVTEFPDRATALAAEAHAIQTEAPRHNVQWTGQDRLFELRNRVTNGALERNLRAWRAERVTFDRIAERLRADDIDVSRTTVHRWCHQLGIERAS